MKSSRFTSWVAFPILFLALSIPCAWAQFTSAVEGTVTDPSGAVVPSASVTLKNVETGVTRSVRASATGYFRFTSLSAAAYTLTASAPGFKTTVQQEFRVQVAETKTVNVTLELGTTTTEVTVTAAPPAVETSQGRVSGLVEEAKVHDLPLVGRNFYTLVVLTPGVTGLPSGGGQAYAQATADIFNAEYGANLNASGQRAESNSFLVDSASVNANPRGGVVNVNPNAESVQELRISVNNFSAEFGRNAAALVNVVTKQGSNDWHGTASWFHTNNALTSRSFFQPKVPVFRRNEGAWSLGGPIWKDHTFVFGSMDILRSGVGTGWADTVATPEFINFMQQNHPTNISTHMWETFPAGIKPVRSFTTAGDMTGIDCSTLPLPSDPIASPVGNIPCNMAVTGEGDFAQTIPRNAIQYNARMDHMFNEDKDRLYGNWYHTRRNTVLFASPSIYPDFSPMSLEYTMYFNLNETHTFSPTVLNDMAVSYTRSWGDDLCNHCEIPGVSVTGMAGFGNGWGPGVFIQNNFEWRDVLSFNRGAHSFKTGFTMQRAQDDANFTGIYERPGYWFQSVFDFALDSPATEWNIAFDPRTGQAVGPQLPNYWAFRQRTLGIFFQDDWKVRPNLTLNLGLRWETFFDPTERTGQLTNIVFRGGNDFFSRIADAKVDQVKSLWKGSDLNNWAPRIGFAWDPTKEGKMSIRGGIGMFYDRPSNQLYSDSRSNPPLFATAGGSIWTPPFLPVYGLGTSGEEPYGFPAVPWLQPGLDEKNGLLAGKVTIETSDPNLRSQYSENWFFGLQYSFARDWVVEANYIGSVGRKAYADIDVNRFAGDLEDGILDRLNTSFGAIRYAQSQFNSSYNGGTVAVKRRYSRGVSFDAAYTFGRAIDQASTLGGNLNIVDITNLRLERGLAGFDIRQKLAVSLLWELPKPNTSSAFVNKFLGGWQIGNISILQSGSPFSVYCSAGPPTCDWNADGLFYDRPNAPSFGNSLSGLDRSKYLAGLFTASDFPAPTGLAPGTLGRNTFIGPGFANTDFSVLKNTKIPWFTGAEGAKLQFRAEFFNVFNRVNLSLPSGDMSSWAFGRSTGTFPARNIQFGLRLSY